MNPCIVFMVYIKTHGDCIMYQDIDFFQFQKRFMTEDRCKKYLLAKYQDVSLKEINNTILISNFVSDLIQSSNRDSGICLSCESLELMNRIKEISKDIIYNSHRLECYKKFAELMLKSIFEVL